MNGLSQPGVETDTLIVGDGFGCREKIRQWTGREALHVADVLAMDIDDKNGSDR